MIRYKKSFLKNSIRGKKTSKHTIVKGASTSTFDDKMSVGVLILSHITGNGGKKFLFFFFFFKKRRIAQQNSVFFSGSPSNDRYSAKAVY